MPDEHIPRHSPELQQLFLVVLKTLGLDVHEHGIGVHSRVAMRRLEVHGGTVGSGSFVHGDPKSDPLLRGDRTILIILMPFEALVGVDHEEIGRDADFVGPACLCEYVSHGRVVVKVGEAFVCLPYVTLDVVIQLGGSAGEGPEVGVGDLVARGGSEVFDPLRVEDALDVDDAVSLERLDLFLGQFVLFRSRDAWRYSVGEGEAWVL